ncbi:MAG: aldehyde dehydrogenase [Mucinivorans sp.]
MELKNQVQAQRDFFASRATLPYEFRRAALENLLKGIKRHEQDILQALWIDLRKSEFEAWGTEVGIVESEIRYAIKNLKKWMRTGKRPTPLMLFPSQSRIVQEPLGVSLIIAPWNYPFQLVLMPLVGAIAAGNCAMVKPSTAAQATAEILEKIINEVFDPNYVKVINGENSLTDELLAERFDYIFYTGGIGYGKYVATAAAKHLTPTTLELGGKSPCIVARDADIALAARRIVWGKMLNAGQTCVAPDYILVDQDVKQSLAEHLCVEIERQFGSNPQLSPDYARIINDTQFKRLVNLMGQANVICGGQTDAAQRYIAPTVMDQVDIKSELMTSEIFGPLLPIVGFDNIDQAIDYVVKGEKPLALYCFTKSKQTAKRIIQHTSSGGACVNDVVVHVASTYLPFGGVGLSGWGTYHGKATFDTFSHARAVISTTTAININVKFAPYLNRIKILKRFM